MKFSRTLEIELTDGIVVDVDFDVNAWTDYDVRFGKVTEIEFELSDSNNFSTEASALLEQYIKENRELIEDRLLCQDQRNKHQRL